jgi:ankyrin repeat protein
MTAREAFIEAATWHGSLERAEALLAEHPELPKHDLHAAAIVGDDTTVQRLLERDPKAARDTSPPYGGDALTYLGLSKYLRLDPARTPAFLRAATALLDAGADPNAGFWTTGQHREHETALYGAAGVAHHAELTRLLLERGADPNDVEAVYHSPETYDNDAMKLLVETGKLSRENLSLMLIRKHDWHDYDGVKYLLERGADPNYQRERGWLAIHHAVARNNRLAIVELLLDYGADPTKQNDGATAIERAARRGRGDLLELFKQRGFALEFSGVDKLIAACAMADRKQIASLQATEPALVQELLAQGPRLLAEFTSTWNTEGVEQLLALGVPVDARYEGDGYFDIAPGSTALHVAAWNIRADLVQLLLGRGALVNAKDAKGRTALQLAVKACVDSYWSERRSPEPASLLLDAGASTEGLRYPSGYDELDRVLKDGGC